MTRDRTGIASARETDDVDARAEGKAAWADARADVADARDAWEAALAAWAEGKAARATARDETGAARDEGKATWDAAWATYQVKVPSPGFLTTPPPNSCPWTSDSLWAEMTELFLWRASA